MVINRKFFIHNCLFSYVIMENSLHSVRFASTTSERQLLLEKRLISIENQIKWLEKIKKTVERQLVEEKQRNY